MQLTNWFMERKMVAMPVRRCMYFDITWQNLPLDRPGRSWNTKEYVVINALMYTSNGYIFAQHEHCSGNQQYNFESKLGGHRIHYTHLVIYSRFV